MSHTEPLDQTSPKTSHGETTAGSAPRRSARLAASGWKSRAADMISSSRGKTSKK